MGRFHRHDDEHGHTHHHHDHDHDFGDHSGYATGAERISVLEDIFHENDHKAAANRKAFEDNGVVCINVMSSPGAGKTTLLQKTLVELSNTTVNGAAPRAGVIEGDIETAIDAERLQNLGAQISLLNTGQGFGGECHLDAPMVAAALQNLDLEQLDAVFVENVGNLVCPAEFEVGEHHKVMVASVTEGEDKPLKYPVMFKAVEVVVINKIDLLPYLDFDLEQLIANIRQVNPTAQILPVSTKTGEGIDQWITWLTHILGGVKKV